MDDVRILVRAMAPIARAVYPYMTSKRNLKLFKKIYYMTMMFAVAIGAGIFLTSDLIVRIVFGPGMEMSASVLRVFAVLLPLAAILLDVGANSTKECPRVTCPNAPPGGRRYHSTVPPSHG